MRIKLIDWETSSTIKQPGQFLYSCPTTPNRQRRTRKHVSIADPAAIKHRDRRRQPATRPQEKSPSLSNILFEHFLLLSLNVPTFYSSSFPSLPFPSFLSLLFPFLLFLCFLFLFPFSLPGKFEHFSYLLVSAFLLVSLTKGWLKCSNFIFYVLLIGLSCA